ncbi:hypothetical protein ABZ897_56425 [Nonomuraea sp. NPDC046802]|uniref:hypothetical protein n=1 Tax=Nonomuraea sp. NPDC046802 TaxID=3154919 RepID=UPI0033CB8994
MSGVNGTGPASTLEQFKRHVAEKKIRYVIGTGTGDFAASAGGSDNAARIAEWVRHTFTAGTVDGATAIDLAP